MEYKSFDLLNKLYFERVSGSKEELKAANILLEEVKSLGVDDVKIEEFNVNGYNIKQASLEINGKEYECCGVGMSGSTTKDGIKANLVYVGNENDAKTKDIEGKIVLYPGKIMRPVVYKELIKKNVVGVVLATGSVYEPKENVDLDPYMYRERVYKLGKIPAVCIRIADAENIIRLENPVAKLINVEDEFSDIKSHNVVATIKGTRYEDQIVAFSAHYDSVSYSKGAYDNATGSTCIMQLLAYFSKNKPERTLKFVWCGSEEQGLLGSKAYVESIKDQIDKYILNVNVDMIGVTLGSDIAVVTGESALADFVKYEGMINGFAISTKCDVYSSDSSSFADAGVPAITFARIAPAGGSSIHSHKDVMDYLTEKNYYETCDFMEKVLTKIINAKAFPVERVIPNDIKESLDKYFGRKDK